MAADGKRVYVNLVTGECIETRRRSRAIKYFKADGKAWGYKVKRKQVIAIEKYRSDGRYC